MADENKTFMMISFKPSIVANSLMADISFYCKTKEQKDVTSDINDCVG